MCDFSLGLASCGVLGGNRYPNKPAPHVTRTLCDIDPKKYFIMNAHGDQKDWDIQVGLTAHERIEM